MVTMHRSSSQTNYTAEFATFISLPQTPLSITHTPKCISSRGPSSSHFPSKKTFKHIPVPLPNYLSTASQEAMAVLPVSLHNRWMLWRVLFHRASEMRREDGGVKVHQQNGFPACGVEHGRGHEGF